MKRSSASVTRLNELKRPEESLFQALYGGLQSDYGPMLLLLLLLLLLGLLLLVLLLLLPVF